MKRALWFLVAGIVTISVAADCTPSVMCKQHMVEAELRDKEDSGPGKCLCVYEHVVDATGEVHRFRLNC